MGYQEIAESFDLKLTVLTIWYLYDNLIVAGVFLPHKEFLALFQLFLFSCKYYCPKEDENIIYHYAKLVNALEEMESFEMVHITVVEIIIMYIENQQSEQQSWLRCTAHWSGSYSVVRYKVDLSISDLLRNMYLLTDL